MLDPDDETPRELPEDEFFEAFENAPLTLPRWILQRRGFEPLRPEAVPDNELTGRLWELLYALAAHRCFFHFTDGLTDAELYRFLDAWLDEPHEDIPLCLEMNCRCDCSGSDSGDDSYLKYADDRTREMCQEMDPTLELPLKETPPADRDRFMPQPPEPPFVPADATGGIPPDWPGGDEKEPFGDNDPLGLAAVDAAIAAERHGAAEPEPELPPEKWQRPADELKATGYTPVPPDELTEDTAAPFLWELLHQLAIRNFFVTHTDHLSDMALYWELWGKAIREESLMPRARRRTGYWMHDILGSYGEAECNLQLAIYATDAERARHVEQFPNWPLPGKQPRLIRRDWRLPRPPF